MAPASYLCEASPLRGDLPVSSIIILNGAVGSAWHSSALAFPPSTSKHGAQLPNWLCPLLPSELPPEPQQRGRLTPFVSRGNLPWLSVNTECHEQLGSEEQVCPAPGLI